MARVSTSQGSGLKARPRLKSVTGPLGPSRPREAGHSRDVAGVHVQTRAEALEGAAALVVPAEDL